MKKATLAVALTAFLACLCAFALLILLSGKPGAELTLAPGEMAKLEAARDAVFQSENPLIASVSLFGEITALTPGETTVTVTDRTGERRISVTVSGVPLTHLAFPQKEAMLLVGESWAVPFEINRDAADARLNWTSSDDTIATVSGDGILTAHAPGTVCITARAMNGLTAECEVTVVAPE